MNVKLRTDLQIKTSLSLFPSRKHKTPQVYLLGRLRITTYGSVLPPSLKPRYSTTSHLSQDWG